MSYHGLCPWGSILLNGLHGEPGRGWSEWLILKKSLSMKTECVSRSHPMDSSASQRKTEERSTTAPTANSANGVLIRDAASV
jgi:hypothetical protein